jgi:hypothetical protein
MNTTTSKTYPDGTTLRCIGACDVQLTEFVATKHPAKYLVKTSASRRAGYVRVTYFLRAESI